MLLTDGKQPIQGFKDQFECPACEWNDSFELAQSGKSVKMFFRYCGVCIKFKSRLSQSPKTYRPRTKSLPNVSFKGFRKKKVSHFTLSQ